MERFTRYTILVDLDVVEGCFTRISDLMDYIKYRLALRGRSSDGVKLGIVKVIEEKKFNDQLEMKL